MDLRQLETFVAVARLGHFTRAADELHLTQSAVSQHVARLEASLGVRLLERGTRGAAVTPEGRELLGRAEAILADVSSARAAVSGQGALVRVAGEAPGLAAALTLDRCSYVQATGAAALALLREGRVDLAVGVEAADGYVTRLLAPEPLVLLGGTGALADLRDRPVLLPVPGLAARTAANRAFAAVGFSPVPRFEAADGATARALVDAGLAQGVVPASWGDGVPVGVAVERHAAHRRDVPTAVAALAARL